MGTQLQAREFLCLHKFGRNLKTWGLGLQWLRILLSTLSFCHTSISDKAPPLCVQASPYDSATSASTQKNKFIFDGCNLGRLKLIFCRARPCGFRFLPIQTPPQKLALMLFDPLTSPTIRVYHTILLITGSSLFFMVRGSSLLLGPLWLFPLQSGPYC